MMYMCAVYILCEPIVVYQDSWHHVAFRETDEGLLPETCL